MRDTLLMGKNISKTFSCGGKKSDVLSDVTVDICRGDFTIIMGPSGTGKSTLLYALSGMDDISGGCVEYEGKNLGRLSEKEMARLRAREFGFVFQQSHMVSNLTLFENITVAGYAGTKENGSEVLTRTEELMREMGIWEVRNQLPHQASGGEQQRAAIARAVVNRPRLLFADEPSGALNRSNTKEVLDLLSSLNHKGQSILMVTHDLYAAIRGNRILYLEDGKILAELELEAYDAGAERNRETKVSEWLSGLQW